jgi:hypothetical protein
MNTSRKHLIFSLIAGLIFGVAISIAPLVDARIYNPSSASALSGTVPVTSGGTGTSTAFTEGSVVFATSTGAYSQDNSNLFYNANTKRFGIGTNSPTAVMHAVTPTSAAAIGFFRDDANGVDVTLFGASGGLNIRAGGGDSLRLGSNGVSDFVRIDTTGFVSIGTSTSPTHALTFPTTSTGIALYNTADQVTNYERVVMQWASNVFGIRSQFAGTGTARGLALSMTTGGGTSDFVINRSATSLFSFSGGGSSQTNAVGITQTLSGSSGNQNEVSISPAIQQSGTAGYTGLLIQPTETSLGSGAKNLIQAGTAATTTLWALDNNGHHITGGKTPMLSSCGSGPSISGSDHSGTVTGGTGSTGCTVTFGTAYATAPHCTVTPRTGSVLNAFSYTISTTALTVTQTGLDTGLFDYVCTQ